MPNVTFTYKQDAETVYRFASDPDVTKARAEALGDENVRVTVQESGGSKTVTCTRLVEADLPAFAKKIFKPKNTVVERREWRDNGERKGCHFHVDVQGTPTKIDGNVTIAPAASGSTYSIDFEVTAKVPLIRKKLEEYIVGLTQESIKDEFNYNQQQLDAGWG